MGIKVYKASAGSGKTYTLVYEYIRFMIEQVLGVGEEREKMRGIDSTLNLHRGILAVTFTNKSTAEMKERIVKALYDLSKGEKKDYVEKLREDVSELAGVDDGKIAKMAERFLIDILQDYTQFRVSTIDGFFQQVVRSFARELNLNNQYQIELETDKILELAVDNMLASLGGDNAELLKWLTEFAADRVDSENSWNPRKSILNLSKLIVTEKYVSQKEKFDLKRLTEYRDHIREIIKKFDEDVKEECEKAEKELAKVNDVGSWFGKGNSCRVTRFYYDNLKSNSYSLTATFINCATSEEGEKAWLNKKYQEDTNALSVAGSLHKYAQNIVKLCDVEGDRFREYQTAKSVNAYLYILGILNEIDKQAMDICRAKDCLLLSSTSDFINRIIDGSDTPFIYEKVGVRTDHFMIDEFQDTSRLQWSNFVSLLRDAVAQGNESMIVGDVKQSIYRWRNGDWKILHEGVDKEFVGYVNHEPLEKNYRSTDEVREFNNLLYRELPKMADEQLMQQEVIKGNYLQDIYADSEQKKGKKNVEKGYVRVEFFDKEEDKEKEKATWKDQSLDRMVELMRAQECYGEMAVLVRTNKEAQKVAEKLKEERIPFYSSEALCVADDVAVRFILAVLEYVMQPYEQLFRSNIVALHREVCLGRIVGEEDYELMSYRGDDYKKWEGLVFGDEAIVDRFGRIKYTSLLQSIESLIVLFGLNSVDGGVHSIYLQSFMDKVQTYAIDGTLDIRSLLEYWKVQGEKTFIAMPEGGDAVRIITIHKSKGLEFGMVFIPFMDWTMGLPNKDNIQLVRTETKSHDNHIFVDEVPVVPINMRSSKKLFNSEFKDDTVEEFLAACLDELNVLYVATTRASQQLYLHCNVPKTEKKNPGAIESISIARMLRSVLVKKDSEETVYESNDKVDYSLEEKKEEKVENIELEQDKNSLPTEEEVAERAKLRFKYSEDTGEGDARRYGLMMHRLFERIVVLSDVDGAIDWIEREGDSVDGLRSEVDEILATEGVAELFDARWRVMNEAEIFDGEKGNIYRPDRVMIDEERNEVVVLDYKFGEYTEETHLKYKKQVGRYVRLIKEMGYDARGCILYAKERKLQNI